MLSLCACAKQWSDLKAVAKALRSTSQSIEDLSNVALDVKHGLPVAANNCFAKLPIFDTHVRNLELL